MGISTALEAPAAAQPREAAAAGSSPGGLAARPCADRQSTACRALSRSPVFLATLVLVTSLGPLAMSAFVPAIPMIQAEFAVDGAVAQLTLSVSLIAMAFASLVYGSLADRYGRRPVLLFGIAVGVLGSVLCAVGPTIGSVIAGRALQATGASTGFVLARVIVQDVYGSARSARVLAYVTAAMTLAPLIGPLAGGYLIDGVGWRAVLVATALAAAALLVLVALRLPETAPRLGVSRRATPARDIAELLRNASYLKFMAFGTMSMAAFYSFAAGAPYVMSEVLGYPATVYGYYFAMVPCGYFVGSMLAGRLSGRSSHETLTLTGALAGVAACTLGWLWTAGAESQPLALFVPAALLSVASGLALPGAQAGMLAAAGPHAGAGSGLFSFLQLMASAVTAQLVGFFQALGPTGVLSVMAGASVLALAGYGLCAAAEPAAKKGSGPVSEYGT